MGTFVTIVAPIGLLVWFIGGKRTRRTPAPEDDVETPVDRAELEEAERELGEDESARPLRDGVDDDEDDWGPGRT